MDKQIKCWIDVLVHTKETIISTFNYNGIIIDDLEALIKDMERAEQEAKNKVRICDECTENKFIQENLCKKCWSARLPY